MFGYYVKVALHNAARNKVITGLVILAISVGIGASMTTLTVMHILSGDPLPGKSGHIYYPQVDVNPESKGREPYDVMDYRTAFDLWSAKQADSQAMVVSNPVKVRSEFSGGVPLMISSISTTSEFFAMFDVPLQYGRAWGAEDDARRSRVAVISDRLNQQLFGGRNSVGQSLRVKDTNLQIIGVLGPWRPSPLFYKIRGGRFSGGETSGFYGVADDVFLPLSASLEINEGDFQPFTCWATPDRPGVLESSPCVAVALWVKLSGPERVQGYDRFLRNYAAEQKRLGRIKHDDNTRLRSLMEWLDFNQVVPSDVKVQTVLAFAFLLICLANVVGLLLAKFMRHGGEIGLRRALGASRVAIFTQCLVEAGLIGALGGVLGLFLTLLGLWMIRIQPVAYADLVHLDIAMFLVTVILSLLTSLLAGAIPAYRASFIQPVTQLKLL
ncbi:MULTISPECIES: ABC transporter permease [Stenotrophomonas]|uniref:ABC transporter permease n=1 Tax=Stenotrophomonas TaxID=40323 RepID=UPI000F76B406|nr:MULTISPECIES: ABC transporter permease [Stenotrophomonas]MBD3739359.1 ABC transporter permease [Stenotrophomonas sp.]RRU83073.1 FtsX-like permease family protein [Stenotrophomonas maltophilia]